MNLKKLFIGGVVAAMALTFFGNVASAASMNDAEFTQALAWGYENGLTRYDTEDAFMPMASVSREAFAKFAAAYAATNLCLEADDTMSCDFSDIDDADPTLQTAIVAACEMGLVKGHDGMFDPKANVSKAAVLTVLDRALAAAAGETPASESMTPRWEGHFNAMRDLGITKETDVYAVDRAVTRYEVFLMLYRARVENPTCTEDGTSLSDLLNELFGDDADTGTDTDTDTGTDTDTDTGTDTDTDTDTANGTLSAVLSPTTPAGAGVPQGASVPVAKFDITADGDATLKSVKLKLEGLNVKALKDATIFVNGEAVSKTKTFNSDKESFITLNPVVSVADGETFSFEVVGTVGTYVGISNEEFAVNLVEVNEEAVGPLVANTFEVAGVAAAKVRVYEDGNVANVELGNTGAEVAKFYLKNESTTHADVTITQVTLKDEGGDKGAENDLRNFVLKHGSDVVATTTTSNGKYLTFVLDTPVVITDGNKEKFKVYADVVDGAGDKIAFTIDKSIYVLGTDSDYGYGLNIVGVNDKNGNPKYDAQQFTINAGEVTLSENHLAINDIRKDKDDLVVASFDMNVNAGKDLSLEDIQFVFNKTTNGSLTGTFDQLFDEVKMRVTINGSATTYDLDLVSATNTQGTWGDTDLGIFLPDTGDILVEVLVDTANNDDVDWAIAHDVAFKVGLDTTPTPTGTFKLIENSDDKLVTDVTPSSITFDVVNFVTSTVSLGSINLKDATPVKGTENVDVLQFTIKTDDVSPAFFDTLTVSDKNVGTGAFDKNHVTAIRLWKDTADGWEPLDSKSAFDITSTKDLTFDSFGEVMIPVASTQKFLVTVDVADSDDIVDDVFAVELTNAHGVNIIDDEGDDLIPSTTTTFPIDSTRAVTILNAGEIAISVDNADSATNNKKHVLAGTTSNYIASFEASVINEPVTVQNLVFTFTGVTNFDDAVSEVVLYDTDKVELDRRDVESSNVVEFNNINYEFKKGTTNLYLKVITKPIGEGEDGAVMGDATVSMTLDGDIKGEAGDDAIVNGSSTTSDSYAFDVIPVYLSVVAISDEGAIDNNQYSNGDNVIGTIELTTDTWVTTDIDTASAVDLTLTGAGAKLSFVVDNDGASVDSVRVERTDLSGVDNTCDTIGSGDVYTVDFSTCDATVAKIAKSTVAAKFEVTVVGTGISNASAYYAQLKFTNLDGGEIVYQSTDTSAPGQVSELRLGDTTISGVKKQNQQ